MMGLNHVALAGWCGTPGRAGGPPQDASPLHSQLVLSVHPLHVQRNERRGVVVKAVSD